MFTPAMQVQATLDAVELSAKLDEIADEIPISPVSSQAFVTAGENPVVTTDPSA